MTLSTATSSNHFTIFNVAIDNMTMSESVRNLLDTRYRGQSSIAYFVNANSLNQAYESHTLTKKLNRADFVFADGCGVRIAAKRKGITVKENVNGTDMLPLLCEGAARENKSIYFFGAAPGIAEKTAQEMKRHFPRLRIAGYHHGFVDSDSSQSVINDINDSNANIVLVGLGTPLQESWLDKYRFELESDIAIAVGGLFDFYSGRIPRAPLWMRNSGIEWVWRLLQEPKNKFYRYVIGNPLFLYRIASHTTTA